MGESKILCTCLREYALRVLLRGLRDPICSLMRTRKPTDLNETLNMLTNDFQLEIKTKPNMAHITQWHRLLQLKNKIRHLISLITNHVPSFNVPIKDTYFKNKSITSRSVKIHNKKETKIIQMNSINPHQ